MRFGFRRIKDAKKNEPHFEVEPSEARVVEKIYELASAGRSDRLIDDELDRLGVTDRHGKRLGRNRVAQILTNMTYCGSARPREFVKSEEYDAIIDRETFEQVQDDRARRAPSHLKGKGGWVSPKHLFSGAGPVLVCGNDGKRLQASSSRDRYRCSHKQNGAANCSLTDPKRPLVDGAITDLLLAEVADIEATTRDFARQSKGTLKDVRQQISVAERSVAEADLGLRNIKVLLRSGDALDLADYQEQRAELTEERTAALAQLERLRSREHVAANAHLDTDYQQRAVAWLSRLSDELRSGLADPSDVEGMRIVASRVIEKVIVHQDAYISEVDGFRFEDGSLNVGGVGLEVVWRTEAVTKQAAFVVADDGDVAGSVYPAIDRQPLSTAGIETS